MQYPFKLYLGMALREAPEEFRGTFQEELKTGLRQIADIEILDFVGLVSGTEVDVYCHDRDCTLTADLCVFIVDHPSIELDMEIMLRHEHGLPLMVFAKQDKRVKRMLSGMLTLTGQQLYRYNSVSDIVEVVDNRIRLMRLRD